MVGERKMRKGQAKKVLKMLKEMDLEQQRDWLINNGYANADSTQKKLELAYEAIEMMTEDW